MWADTEIRRDLIRSWREEAVELWRKVYSSPPSRFWWDEDGEFKGDQLDEDYLDEDELRAWGDRRELSRMAIAVAAMDLDLAREVEGIVDRTKTEVEIHEKAGNPDEIAQILGRTRAISDLQIRARTIAGVGFGLNTPAWARDFGLLGHALSIPAHLNERRFAVASAVGLLGRTELTGWVDDDLACSTWAEIARRTLDPAACRRALELAFLNREELDIRRVLEAIARSGDLALNEWAMRRIFDRERAHERAMGFAILSRGPLGEWAREFAYATCPAIDESEPPFPHIFSGAFCFHEDGPGWARDTVLADLAVTWRDPHLTERMLHRKARKLTLALIGIEQNLRGPLFQVAGPHLRAFGLIEFGRRHRDEAALLEAHRQIKTLPRGELWLSCLTRLLATFNNLRSRPPAPAPAPKPSPRRRHRRRVHPDQLSLPLEV